MIQVIGRALDILELLAKDPEKVFNLSQIADPLQLNHGTCANILKTMVSRKYVEKLDAKKGYRLGMMAFKLADKRDYKTELIEAARKEMEQLTQLFNENTLLSVLSGNQRIAILRVNGKNQLQVVTPTEKDAHNSSTGKLLIAMLSDSELNAFISKYGLPMNRSGNKRLTEAAFRKDVLQIRKQLYATHLPDDEILGIAVPVYQKNKVVASLSMYLPAFRTNEALQKSMLKQLTLSAERITLRLS